MQKLIKSRLQQWIAGLPKYIKAYLLISVCESWVIYIQKTSYLYKCYENELNEFILSFGSQCTSLAHVRLISKTV